MAAPELTCAAVLFDMDGTLVDSTAVVEAVWAEFAERFDVDLAELLEHAHGRLTIDTVREFGPPGSDPVALSAELTDQELTQLEGIVEIPGAARLVADLERAGCPVAVVTSAPRELAIRRMAAAGVPQPDVLVSAEDVTEGKPSPQGYLMAAAQLGVPAADCVVFEDAEAGLRAAVACAGRVVVVGGHRSATTESLPRVADLTSVGVLSAAGDRTVLRLG